MKKNFKRGIAFFLIGLVIMQLVMTDGSRKAQAAHSDKASVKFLGGMALYAETTAADSSLPAPYNGKFISKYMVKTIKDAGKSTYDLSYCIDYDKLVSTGDGLSSKEADAGSLLTLEQARLINYAIMLGYNRQTMDINNTSKDETLQYFATQALIWIIQDNFYYDTVNRAKLEASFFKRWPGIKTYYQNLSKAVHEQMSQPSFIDGKTIEKQAEEGKKVEIVLKNTTACAMKNVVVDNSSLPSGVKATISGETLTITMEKAATTSFTVKLVKNLGKKGRVVAWKTTGGDKQPQATIDYDLDPIALEYQVKVSIKTVKPTPTPAPTPTPTPVPTCPPSETPTCPPVEKPTCPPTEEPTCPPTEEPTCPPVEETVPSEPVVEEPEEEFPFKDVVVEDGSEQDESPKTGDESNLSMVYVCMGASLFAMAGTYILYMLDKRKKIRL